LQLSFFSPGSQAGGGLWKSLRYEHIMGEIGEIELQRKERC
jgi:hypothetical protein